MKIISIAFLLFLCFNSSSEEVPSAYNTQRLKINTLLANRSSKFDQYQNSLSKHTGIFGLKTKKDMQRSNDILTAIIETDNEILKELKVLFDYKDLEKTTVETRAETSETRVSNYMQTITKLQKQVDLMKDNQTHLEAEISNVVYYKLALALFVSIVIFLIYKLKS
ncbi:MAG: hypothetical protein JWQ25_238 [Daejeonella sp.]|nr:hypothetical protein [Daejeonella sp.]